MSATDTGEIKTQLNDTDLPAQPLLFRKRLTGGETATCGAAKFQLRPLTHEEARALRALATGDDGEPDDLRINYLLLCFGLDGVSGLTDEDGAPVEPELVEIEVLGRTYTIVSEEWLAHLEIELVVRLALRVTELSGMARTERLRLDFTTRC